jgi:hypothetical protein
MTQENVNAQTGQSGLTVWWATSYLPHVQTSFPVLMCVYSFFAIPTNFGIGHISTLTEYMKIFLEFSHYLIHTSLQM